MQKIRNERRLKTFLRSVYFSLSDQKIVIHKDFQHLKIALISDELTRSSLAHECQTCNLTPLNYKLLLKLWKPDMLFVESAWQGAGNAWKFKIAAYPDRPERSNLVLRKAVDYARQLGIKCVFWNKEDGVHFERFIDSAKLFDHIFTVDENCIDRYRAVVGPGVTVDSLMFAVQPVTHNFLGFNFKHHRANFVGSYSHHIHDQRRAWQDMVFVAASCQGLGLTVIDRNSARQSSDYRFPAWPDSQIRPAVPHAQTAQIYKDYLVSLNVNTVADSGTMFSRRLVEILACGGIAVSNSCPAIERYFKDYCYLLSDVQEANELFARLKYGPSHDDLARARAGAEYVLCEHTWAHRLAKIMRVIGL